MACKVPETVSLRVERNVRERGEEKERTLQTGSPPVLRRQRVVLPVPQFVHTVPLRFTVV